MMIPKAFEIAFPRATKAAKYEYPNITRRGKAWWLDGVIQLTGYEVSDGKRLSLADNDEIAERKLTEFVKGRDELKGKTLYQRLCFLIDKAMEINAMPGYTANYRHPGGDTACRWFESTQIDVRLEGIGYSLHFHGKGKTIEESIEEVKKSFFDFVGVK